MVVSILFLVSGRDFPDLDILFAVFLALQIPNYIIFIQYYINDYEAEFVFEKAGNRIVYTKKNKILTYSFEDVKLIQLTATAARLKKNGIQMFTKDQFFFYKVAFTDGNTIILTSLLLGGKIINETNFKNMNFKKEAVFFSFLPDA